MSRLWPSLAVAALAVMVSPAQAQVTGDPVMVDGGAISGKFEGNAAVRAYLGVPFAAPPVGELRWRAPEPVKAWDGVHPAISFAAQCMQSGRSKTSVYYEYAGSQPMSEDCLYLNVWAPAADAERKNLPVMVWIYGGGFQQGSAANPVFDGEALARRGVVAVTINYRVGVFGFLAHPELTAESPHHSSGNYGLLDQVAALQWVQRNSAAFGGDPKNVTIFGQSAGAHSVNFLFGSPLARGLFQRGIAESFGFFKTMTSLADAEKQGIEFGKKLNAETLASLRSKSAQEILAGGAVMNPIIDGWFLTDNLYTIFKEGREAPVPLLTGWNANEGATFPHVTTLANYQASIRKKYGASADQLLALYPAKDDEEAKAASKDVFRESIFSWAIWSAARFHAHNGYPTYLYHFEHKQPLPAGRSYDEIDSADGLGAFHSSEYPYIFGTLDSLSRAWTRADRTLSRDLRAYWVNYAFSGNPNGAGLPNWPPFSESSDTDLHINDQIAAGKVPDLDRLRFFDALPSPLGGS